MPKKTAQKQSVVVQPRGQVVSAPELGRGHVFVRPSASARVIDEVIALSAGAVTPFWTVTRKTLLGRVLWGAGIAGFGGIIAMEAQGTEIGNFATGAAAGNLAAVALMLLHPDLSKP